MIMKKNMVYLFFMILHEPNKPLSCTSNKPTNHVTQLKNNYTHDHLDNAFCFFSFFLSFETI